MLGGFCCHLLPRVLDLPASCHLGPRQLWRTSQTKRIVNPRVGWRLVFPSLPLAPCRRVLLSLSLSTVETRTPVHASWWSTYVTFLLS